MKFVTLLCAAFVSLATLAPTTAEAGSHRGGRTRVSHDHCGRPIYYTYTCVAHDHCGRPIYRWVETSRGGDGHRGHGGYRSGHRDHHYGHGRHEGHGHSSRSRGGVSFHFSR